MTVMGAFMTHLKIFLILKIMFVLFIYQTASAKTSVGASSIPAGVYINDSDNPTCSVEVQVESKFWKTHTVTVFEKSLYSKIPDSTVTSDPFSLKEIKKQALDNHGKFLIVTKKTSSKTHKISGRIFEKDGTLFWEVGVSRQSCFGFCTSSSANCTVQIPF